MKLSKNCKNSKSFPAVIDRSGPRSHRCRAKRKRHSLKNWRRLFANGVLSPCLRRHARASKPATRPTVHVTNVNDHVSLLAAAAMTVVSNKHHKMSGQCHIPVERSTCGNLKCKCPIDVSSAMSGLSLQWSVSWYKLVAFAFQINFFSFLSRSRTPVPAKDTTGCARFRK